MYPISLERSLFNMIRLKVEDVPAMEAVRCSILTLLILRNPRSVLCLPPGPLLPHVVHLSPADLLLQAVMELVMETLAFLTFLHCSI